MRAELANLNHCAVPFLSRAAVNLSWYDSTCIYIEEWIQLQYFAGAGEFCSNLVRVAEPRIYLKLHTPWIQA